MILPELAALLGLNLALLVVVMLALWGVSLRLKDVGFIDGVWPLGMLFLAAITFVRTEGDQTRKFLLLWLCAVWAIRLGWHLLRRWHEKGVAGRYAGILEAQERGHGWSFGKTALLFIFLPQAVLGWLTSLPVQLGQVEHGPIGWIGWIGAVVVVVGIGFESVGDAQLSAFRKDPKNSGKVLAAGLWRYTRHPNYFGDACVWWGLWLIAAETGWVGAASVVGPIFLTITLTRWSSVGITEEAIRQARPKYVDYIRRTSAFVPMPPKKV